MRCHPRDKVEISHVPVITPAPTGTLQTGTQQRCFAALIGMVVVLPGRASSQRALLVQNFIIFNYYLFIIICFIIYFFNLIDSGYRFYWKW